VIHIVNYGLGNVQAFLNMYYRLGIEARLASTADDLAEARHIIAASSSTDLRHALRGSAVFGTSFCRASEHSTGP
jgi:hypothetical protein